MSLKLPEVYKSKLKHKIDKLSEKGQGKIVEWVGISLFSQIFYTYLIKKYKSDCYIDKLYFNISLTGDEYWFDEKKELPKINRVCDLIYECSKNNNSNIVLVPFSFNFVFNNNLFAHANLLIFRKKEFMLEHFEPHGIFRLNRQINMQIEDLLKKYLVMFNDVFFKKFNKRMTVVNPESICPTKYGLQTLETSSSLAKNTPGFCLAWTLFFAELVLKNPSYTSKEINDKLLNFDETDMVLHGKNISFNQRTDYLRNLISGYVLLLDETLQKYLSKYYGKDISLSKLIDPKNKLFHDKLYADFTAYVIGESQKKNIGQIDFFENISPVSASQSSIRSKKLNTSQPQTKKQTKSRCPNGTRKNKLTGNCEKNKNTDKQIIHPIQVEKQTKSRCPNGMRKNKLTGNCENYKKNDFT